MIVLIPSYEPDRRLVAVVRDLAGIEGLRVVVVDDGSGPDYAPWFAEAARAGAEVIAHESNRGKGAALRTGFAHIAAACPGQGVVCADSDGQHTSLDILRVAAALDDDADMVLGVRTFTGEVPLRSRVGNEVTKKVFRLVTGVSVADTQTGLRAYPARMLGWLGEVAGDRFEYELHLLLRAAREKRAIREVEIATVYLDDNSSSHFRPLRDSLRIYGPLLGFAGSSALAATIDAALLFGLVAAGSGVTAAVIAARLVSAGVNFTVNRRLVFTSTVPLARAAARYAALAALLLLANLVMIQTLTGVVGSLLVAKLLTESLLFGASFVVQRAHVFAETHRREAPVEPVAADQLVAPVSR